MVRLRFVFPLLFCFVQAAHSTETFHTSVPDEEDSEQSKSAEPSEETDIIPRSVAASTQIVTPITQFPEKTLYDQALSELEQAKSLFKKRDYEAASDVALQAYDDLNGVHIRRPRKKRAKLHVQRRQAAEVYIETSMAYIGEFIRDGHRSPAVLQEGKARLEDLHDVARDFKDLNRLVNHALEQYPASLP